MPTQSSLLLTKTNLILFSALVLLILAGAGCASNRGRESGSESQSVAEAAHPAASATDIAECNSVCAPVEEQMRPYCVDECLTQKSAGVTRNVYSQPETDFGRCTERCRSMPPDKASDPAPVRANCVGQCYTNRAKSERSPGVCDELYRNEREFTAQVNYAYVNCLAAMATETKDASICDRVLDMLPGGTEDERTRRLGNKDNCLLRTAVNLKDAAMCARISEPLAKATCQQRTR